MPDRLRVVVPLAGRRADPTGMAAWSATSTTSSQHLARRDVRITLITRTPRRPDDPAGSGRPAIIDDPPLDVRFVPYRRIPLAGRRGTTVLDRSTVYPVFRLVGRTGGRAPRGGRPGDDRPRSGRERAADMPWRPRRSGAGAPRAEPPGARGVRRDGPAIRGRTPEAGGLRASALGGADVRQPRGVGHRDRSFDPALAAALPARAAGADGDDSERHRPGCLRCSAGPADGYHMRRFAPAGSEYILLSVGRLEQNKGFHVLAEALARLRTGPGTGCSSATGRSARSCSGRSRPWDSTIASG